MLIAFRTRILSSSVVAYNNPAPRLASFVTNGPHPAPSTARLLPLHHKRHVQYHASMPDVVDDKSPHVIPFILSCLENHRKTSSAPFFIGLNGVQGIGKTTLVTSLATTLRKPPHNLRTLTFSIDDLYLPRQDQQALAAAHPHNPLVQHRGQPSTHDIPLGLSVLRALRSRTPNVAIPAYDKSAHKGQGDRVPQSDWTIENRNAPSSAVEVVIFEGWCVGFRSLPDAALEDKWHAARAAEPDADDEYYRQHKDDNDGAGDKGYSGPTPAGRLRSQRLEDVAFVNAALRDGGYDELFTQHLDAFVYLDAERTPYVYAWRLEQEAALRRERGDAGAMSPEDVVAFVDGYYPAYELFAEGVRRGVFRRGEGDGDGGEGSGVEGRQMRLVVGRDRSVMDTEVV